MTYLLDINLLIAALWTTHSLHRKADLWLEGKSVAVCPLAELGFLRISTHPKALRASMADAQRLLKDFKAQPRVQFVADDLPASGLKAETSDAVTDSYLADLAQSHAMMLATFDAGIDHPAIELIP